MKHLVALLLIAASSLGAGAAPRPIACDLSALTASERTQHAKLGQALRHSVLEHRELADGYAFRLPGSALVATAEWVSFERRCCPFFAFALTQAEDQGPVWLRITGTPEVKAFIAEELKL